MLPAGGPHLPGLLPAGAGPEAPGPQQAAPAGLPAGHGALPAGPRPLPAPAPPSRLPLSWLPLPLLLGFTASYSLGLASLPWLLPTQLLPPTNRAATLTLANITSNLGWFVVLKTFQDLQDYAGLGAPFFLYGCVCTFGLIFILIFLPAGRAKTPAGGTQFLQGAESLLESCCHTKSLSGQT